MNEGAPQTESIEVLREQAIAGYKEFIDKGINNPDSSEIPDSAHEIYHRWVKEIDEQASGNREAEHLANLSKTVFYVDAGFTDAGYLDEVREQLNLDLADVGEESDNPLPAVAEAIRSKIKMIEDKLPKSLV